MSLPDRSSVHESPATSAAWIDVCAYEDVPRGAAIAALIGTEQIALIRTRDGTVYAISNYDPFSKTFVLARGIVGDKGGIPKLASPMYKQSFDLRTGACFDDTSVRVPVYPVRVACGRILVRRRERERMQ
jgi:nitrite reductase (NADH) small subunit